MSNEEMQRLTKIERMLEEQVRQTEKLLVLLATGHGKRLDQLEKKLSAWQI